MRSQPAKTHIKSPTTGNQLSSSAAGPNRFNHPRDMFSPRCGFNSGKKRPMITFVTPPSVLPSDATITNAAGVAPPADNSATNTTSEFPGSSVALRKLLPNSEARAMLTLTVSEHQHRPYSHAAPLEYQNQHLQKRRTFPVERQ